LNHLAASAAAPAGVPLPFNAASITSYKELPLVGVNFVNGVALPI